MQKKFFLRSCIILFELLAQDYLWLQIYRGLKLILKSIITCGTTFTTPSIWTKLTSLIIMPRKNTSMTRYAASQWATTAILVWHTIMQISKKSIDYIPFQRAIVLKGKGDHEDELKEEVEELKDTVNQNFSMIKLRFDNFKVISQVKPECYIISLRETIIPM